VGELALLDDLLRQVRAGEPVTVLVCGEAGAGKTRLVTELVAVAGGGGTRGLLGGCTPVGRRSFAFAPFVEALRPVVRELATGGGDGAGPVGPRLARLASGPGDGATGGDPLPAGPFGMSAESRLFAEVLDTVERIAGSTGVLVVIEDLHWADPSSRDLFACLARGLRGAGVLLVGTVRTDEPDDPGFLTWLAEVQRGPRAMRLDLERFGREETGELVAGVLGEPPSAELVGRVFERSGGNAFLAEEILAAAERGVLVPTTVGGPVLARVATLSASARDLLRLAAVAGTHVSHGLLASAAGVDDAALLAAARELTENHLFVADPSRQGYAFRHALTREAVEADLLPGERQQLHRALARALTDDAAVGPPAPWAVAEAIAEHWLAAGDLAPALAASIAAGDAARGVAAVAAALGHYERALALWDRVTDPESVAGIGRRTLLASAAEVASGAGEHERALQHVDAAIGELADVTAPSRQVGLLCERKGSYLMWLGQDDAAEWTGRAVALVPPDPPTRERAHVLATHALALMIGGRHDEASQAATAALEAAHRTGARTEEARARGALGSCLVMTSSDPGPGLRELEHAVALGRTSGDAETVAHWSSNLTDALVRLGRFDEAAAAGLEAAQGAEQAHTLRNELGYVLFNAAEALFLAGRWDDCEHVLDRVRDQHARGVMELWGFGLRALLHAVRGADDAAAAAIEDAAAMGTVQAEGTATVAAAHAHLALHRGDLEAARRNALDGLDAVTVGESEPGMATTSTLADLCLRIEADRAQLAHARGDPVAQRDAVASTRTAGARTLTQCLRAAAAAHRPEVTRAHRALADAEVERAEGEATPGAWHRAADVTAGAPHRHAYARFREAEAVLSSRGERARAVDVLISAHVLAGELRAEPLRREVEDLARRARIDLTDRATSATGTGSSEPADLPLGLTAREVEVLRLLAAGYTNPQIGEALYISRKTASHHVSSILTKLGVRTRVEAAGVAHRVGAIRDDVTPR
jgi:DNA-binding CsgD family transcriptional regulator/tetratricopeptide (TPR) repeat protein